MAAHSLHASSLWTLAPMFIVGCGSSRAGNIGPGSRSEPGVYAYSGSVGLGAHRVTVAGQLIVHDRGGSSVEPQDGVCVRDGGTGGLRCDGATVWFDIRERRPSGTVSVPVRETIMVRGECLTRGTDGRICNEYRQVPETRDVRVSAALGIGRRTDGAPRPRA
jgi:hypothetical protein